MEETLRERLQVCRDVRGREQEIPRLNRTTGSERRRRQTFSTGTEEDLLSEESVS